LSQLSPLGFKGLRFLFREILILLLFIFNTLKVQLLNASGKVKTGTQCQGCGAGGEGHKRGGAEPTQGERKVQHAKSTMNPLMPTRWWTETHFSLIFNSSCIFFDRREISANQCTTHPVPRQKKGKFSTLFLFLKF
jgi:hypothetical protein